MSDKVLKELLREEKKRRETDRGNNRDRANNRNREHRDRSRRKSKDRKSKDRKSRDKNRSRHRRSKSEGSKSKLKEESIEIVKPEVEEQDLREKFMFLYEDSEGKLYKSLDKIEHEATIFPVYFEGENDNLTPEVITYREDRWTPSEENADTTWLNVINSKDENIVILDFDEKDVVVYNGKFFHCIDDLIYYLKEYGCEYLDVIE